MKSKIVMVAILGLLLVVLFMTRFTGNVNGENNEKSHQVSKINVQTHRITDQPDHLFYFVQISDIHLSLFRDQKRITDFRKFVHDTLEAIKPPVVIASGDLVDGRGKDFFVSEQYDEECRLYSDILSTAKAANRTTWLDLRGNHDNFNVPLSMVNNTHFQRFGVQGPKHKRSYMQLVKDPSGDLYSFIAVDASLEPGPKRPYNFVGVLTQNDSDHIQHMVDESRKAGVSYTIWFGHYPTTCISTRNKEGRSLRRMIREYNTSLAYLCGHLHSLAGLVPHMYALQEDSFLELEVADWKNCRKYRVAAIDHGLLSFVDVNHGDWPIVLITNPKHALFWIPHRDEGKTQLDSTHIRILIFSKVPIRSCTIKIGKDFKENCRHVIDNLYVVPWDPTLYREGIHYITVTVVDEDSRENQVVQPFRFDEKQSLHFDTLAMFVLYTDATFIFKSVFWFSLFLCVSPLIFFRIWHELVKAGKLKRMRGSCRGAMSIVQHYWLVSAVDRIFWPVILYCFYLAFGPWVFCDIVDGHYGIVFAWGIYLDGAFLPGSLTYLYGASQLLFCQFPLNWVFSRCLAKRYFEVLRMPAKSHRGWWKKFFRALFYLIMTVEVALAIFFGLLYGAMAFLLGVSRTWSVVINLYLYYLARNVPDNALKSAIFAWSGTDKTTNDDPRNTTNIDHHTN